MMMDTIMLLSLIKYVSRCNFKAESLSKLNFIAGPVYRGALCETQCARKAPDHFYVCLQFLEVTRALAMGGTSCTISGIIVTHPIVYLQW